MPRTEVTFSGLEYLHEATKLLQDVRRAHPTAGVWEAADLQWWWRTPRSTDTARQVFWTDAAGRSVAAAIVTDWGGRLGLDVIAHPSCDEATSKRLWSRAMTVLA